MNNDPLQLSLPGNQSRDGRGSAEIDRQPGDAAWSYIRKGDSLPHAANVGADPLSSSKSVPYRQFDPPVDRAGADTPVPSVARFFGQDAITGDSARLRVDLERTIVLSRLILEQRIAAVLIVVISSVEREISIIDLESQDRERGHVEAAR